MSEPFIDVGLEASIPKRETAIARFRFGVTHGIGPKVAREFRMTSGNQAVDDRGGFGFGQAQIWINAAENACSLGGPGLLN